MFLFFQNGAFLTFLNAKATLGKLKQDLSLTEPFNTGRGVGCKKKNLFFFKDVNLGDGCKNLPQVSDKALSVRRNGMRLGTQDEGHF